MVPGRVNMILDGLWGSCGKGKMAAALAREFGIRHASANNMPNAGHTVVDEASRAVYKILPAASSQSSVRASWLGPGTIFNWAQLAREMAYRDHTVYMHANAIPLAESDANTERKTLGAIASTAQGSGAAMIRKIMRGAVVCGDLEEWDETQLPRRLEPWRWLAGVRGALKDGWLHEVSQGFGLSLDHGYKYPHTTSRNCTPTAGLDALGVPPALCGDIYMVLRPYPIRVGNANGWSGPCPNDTEEISWAEVAARSGLDVADLERREHTTVTGRLRRVFEWSDELLSAAVKVCAPTKMCLSFVEQLDAGAYQIRDPDKLMSITEVRAFRTQVEKIADAPVVAISTGEETHDICWYRPGVR